MKSSGLLEAIAELSQERGLEQEAIIEAIGDAIVGAAYRKYKNYKNIEAVFNTQSGKFDLMHYKIVVENIEEPDNEITIDEAHELDPLAECGDEVEYEIDSSEFAGVIAQTARQLIFQKINEVERESVIEKYLGKVKEIVHGTVSRFERGKAIVLINNTVEAVLERKEQIPFEKVQPGDNIRALLLEVRSEGRGPQLFLSRTHPEFLIKLFEVEIPEVYDGVIDVFAAAREPGKRAKIAVHTNDIDVDPVGACVGVRGSRIQTVVSELCGERIDVVEWSTELEQFIANALAPADIIELSLNQEKRIADIKIMPDQLSLAIGKQGQNVRLASKLTGITINIVAWEPSEKNPLDGPIGDPISEKTENDPIGDPDTIGNSSDPIGNPDTIGNSSDPIGNPDTIGNSSDLIGNPDTIGNSNDPIGDPDTIGNSSDPIGEPDTVGNSIDPISDPDAVGNSSNPISDPVPDNVGNVGNVAPQDDLKTDSIEKDLTNDENEV